MGFEAREKIWKITRFIIAKIFVVYRIKIVRLKNILPPNDHTIDF